MKNITVVDYNGITYEGEWNGKTYTSQVLGREDLYRMYVSNEAIHITKEELKKISDDVERSDKEISDGILKMIMRLPTKQRRRLFIDYLCEDLKWQEHFKESIFATLKELGYEKKSNKAFAEFINNFRED